MTKTKIALLAWMALVAVFTISFGITTPAQAHCQRGYDCWARSQGHYGNQQRWSYGERQMFRPAVRSQQPRARRVCQVLISRTDGHMIPIYC